MAEIYTTAAKGFRTLITTLTKKMAEHLTEYLSENGVKVTYMHSDTDTLDRINVISALKAGDFDVLVGINLLREGLDIPECALVAILDADKEGYLRSKTALVQTIGRAARNTEGKVILYADKITNSMREAIAETNRRRQIQETYNIEHNISPKSIIKKTIARESAKHQNINQPNSFYDIIKQIANLEKEMQIASNNLLFEEAAKYRDQIRELRRSSSL
jgi:excinuclease ABC subunit B